MNAVVPEEALDRLEEIRSAHLQLIEAIKDHSSFQRQHDARNGKIFWMWDFVMRTDQMFNAILDNKPPVDTPSTRDWAPPVPPSEMNTTDLKKLKAEACGRCWM
jgi:hypothetical protein